MPGEGQQDCEGARADLVVMALPGVQQFIAEARSTADVAAASQIYAELAVRIARFLCDEAGGDPVLPARDAGAGAPNRVVALLPAGAGAAAARGATEAAHGIWQDWIRRVWHPEPAPQTPGFPHVQWVCVPAGPGGYAVQWQRAQRLLASRMRIRDFVAAPEEDWRRRVLCSLAPRWPAEPQAPPRAPRHERATPLSAVGWVKRRWRYLQGDGGFPSTASIASAPYRRAVLQHLDRDSVREAVRDLADAARQIPGGAAEAPVPGLVPLIPDGGTARWFGVSGGPWVYPERWQAESLARQAGLLAGRDAAAARQAVEGIRPHAEAGLEAACALHDAMKELAPPVASYLAVVVQDLDSMGLFLGGQAASAAGKKIPVDHNEHQRVCSELLRVAGLQGAELLDEAVLGMPVYAGGDDLLAFVPAVHALDVAQKCHDLIPSSLPHASTAVLFFHYHASIQQAMRAARALLEEAKKALAPRKHAMAVGYLRRSGVSAVSIQPWPGPGERSSAGLFRVFGRGQEQPLSPRLVADLERDARELSSLMEVSERLYRAELARLVRRHSGEQAGGRAAAAEVAEALDWLGRNEHAEGQAGGRGPHVAGRIGVFLRKEAR